MLPILTYRDRRLSLWQSAVEEVLGRTQNQSINAVRGESPAVMATALAAALEEDKPLVAPPALPGAAGAALAALAHPVAAVGAWRCAKLAFQLAWARVQRDDHAVKQIQQEWGFSSCDPLWAETVEHFLLYFRKDKGSIPYRSGGDYVLDYQPPARATLALIGDWGTGTDPARRLLEQVARKQPDAVIHLGDIYYSGTPTECRQRFQEVWEAVLPAGTRVFTLSGNHDMYSGGEGYYGLVDQLGQQASYFCIRNADWQFLALDTGYNDFNPLHVNSTVTSLTPVEAAWHRDKIKQVGARKTVLLSHHPLFSAFEPIGGGAVNGRLLDTFKDVLGGVTFWFWGHEHRLDVYGPHLGLERGRCLGSSAIPVFVEPGFFQPKFPVPLLEDPPGSGRTVRLGDDGTVYNRAYAIMQLDGPSATVSYYQDSDEERPLFVEKVS